MIRKNGLIRSWKIVEGILKNYFRIHQNFEFLAKCMQMSRRSKPWKLFSESHVKSFNSILLITNPRAALSHREFFHRCAYIRIAKLKLQRFVLHSQRNKEKRDAWIILFAAFSRVRITFEKSRTKRKKKWTVRPTTIMSSSERSEKRKSNSGKI